MLNHAPTLVVRELRCGVRPVRLRLPFRFGSVTLQACPQLFVQVVADIGTQRASGFAAEMMVPKWFDKRGARSHVHNVADLVDSVTRAAAAYTADQPATAFDLFERHYTALMQAGTDAGATALSAAYGQSVIDRAVIDALCRAVGVSFFDAVRGNVVGLQDTPLLPDLRGLDWSAWLTALSPLREVAARHTVGMLDALDGAVDDAQGLPVSLDAVIARYGHRYFKIKLGGQPQSDAQRLANVLSVLDQHAPGHHFSLDGNEQYANAQALRALFAAMHEVPALRRRPEALLYIEQPLARDGSFDAALPWAEAPAPLLMDEADATLDAFARGYCLGWHGVSSKSCKGVYKAIANRARCDRFNDPSRREGQPPRAFMSAEDLTCQAGLSVQQDLALAALLGLSHAERNGHHYGNGFGAAPVAEQRAFVQSHADLYGDEPPTLRITHGKLSLNSLFGPGFAHAADPDMSSLQALTDATALV